MANKGYKICDELLAAFLDGNTGEAEAQEVLNALNGDPALQEVIGIALDLEDEQQARACDVLPVAGLAADSADSICSVLCEAFILRRRDIPIGESRLLAVARENHWLTPDGSPLHSIGQLAAHFGLMVTRRYDASADDIRAALALDNDVIVVVDKEKLYRMDDNEDAPNHVVVVRGVQQDGGVALFDPVLQQPDVTVSLPSFMEAWKESHCYMVRVLQSAEDYVPQPVCLDDISLTDDLIELREAIAENAHDVWAAARMKEGWTFGPQRDDIRKKHPDLIPYSSLPDGEKEYDRLMALDTIKLVKKLGFEIVRKTVNE